MTISAPAAIRDAVQVAADGKRALIFAPNQRVARTQFEALIATEQLQRSDVTVQKTYGRERVTFPGAGRIEFLSVNVRGMRGMSAEHVFIPESITDGQLAQIVPILATTRDGGLTRYEQ